MNFEFDSIELTEQAIVNLDVVGKAFQREELSEKAFLVGGHTDDVGPESYNMALSQRRARAVESYLINAHQVDNSRLTTRGFGEERPLESGTQDEARAMNRRVEFGLQ